MRPFKEPEQELKRLLSKNKFSDLREDNLRVVDFAQAGGYTFVRITNFKELLGMGFSKCSPLDTFDSAVGLSVALARALEDIYD